MSDGRSAHAEALRRRFDESFAEPPASPRPVRQRLLLIQVGTDACGVALSDCAAVERTVAVTRLPRAHPAFEHYPGPVEAHALGPLPPPADGLLGLMREPEAPRDLCRDA